MPEPGSDFDVVSPSDDSHDEVHNDQQTAPRSHICQQLLPSVEHLIGSYRSSTDSGRFVHWHCSKARSSRLENSDARRKLYRVIFRGTSADSKDVLAVVNLKQPGSINLADCQISDSDLADPESEQARFNAKYYLAASSPTSFQQQVLSHFFKK